MRQAEGEVLQMLGEPFMSPCAKQVRKVCTRPPFASRSATFHTPKMSRTQEAATSRLGKFRWAGVPSAPPYQV